MPFFRFWRSFAVVSIVALTASAQQPAATAPPTAGTPLHPATVPLIKPHAGHAKPLAPTETYFRIMCVVPLVGTGKRQDPMRPAYVPVHKAGDSYHSGIIAWTQMPADDGKHAIVEIVATNRAALQTILSANSPDVVVFERGKHTRAQMEAGLQKYRKDFSFDKFPRAVAQ